MSYSISAQGVNKEAALADATAKLDEMIVTQPVHSRDREAALANLRAHLDLLAEANDNEQVVLSMYGAICVMSVIDNAFGRVTNAGSGCSANIVANPLI